MDLRAIHYGEVQLISGIFCDAYILNNGETVMSERGLAALLGIDHKSLRNMGGNWPPKSLLPFCNKSLNMGAKSGKVETNSHYNGRKILFHLSVYNEDVEELGKNLFFPSGQDFTS